MAFILRRRDGRHVWVDPGAPVPVLEELPPNYGRLLMGLMNGELEAVSHPSDEVRDQLAALSASPPPSPPTRAGRWRRPLTA